MGAYIGVRGERVVQVGVLMILDPWVWYKGGGWPAGTWAVVDGRSLRSNIGRLRVSDFYGGEGEFGTPLLWWRSLFL